MTVRACPTCNRIHCAADVTAVGRFTSTPATYRTPDGRAYLTREAAAAAWCRARAKEDA